MTKSFRRKSMISANKWTQCNPWTTRNTYSAHPTRRGKCWGRLEPRSWPKCQSIIEMCWLISLSCSQINITTSIIKREISWHNKATYRSSSVATLCQISTISTISIDMLFRRPYSPIRDQMRHAATRMSAPLSTIWEPYQKGKVSRVGNLPKSKFKRKTPPKINI